jgi:hypothetical protein
VAEQNKLQLSVFKERSVWKSGQRLITVAAVTRL